MGVRSMTLPDGRKGVVLSQDGLLHRTFGWIADRLRPVGEERLGQRCYSSPPYDMAIWRMQWTGKEWKILAHVHGPLLGPFDGSLAELCKAQGLKAVPVDAKVLE